MPTIFNPAGTIAPNETFSFSTSADMLTIDRVELGGHSLVIISESGNVVSCRIPPSIPLAWGGAFTLAASDGVNNASLSALVLQAPSGWSYATFDGNAPAHDDSTESFHELAFMDLGLSLSTGDQIQYSDSPGLTVAPSGVADVNPAQDCEGMWTILDVSSSFRFPEQPYFVFDPELKSLTGLLAPGSRISFTKPMISSVTAVTLGGEFLTIVQEEGQVVTCDIPNDIPIPWGSEVTLSASDGAITLTQPNLILQARSGWGYAVFDGIVPPSSSTESFHELAAQDIPFTLDVGDQIQHSHYPQLTVNSSGVPTVNPGSDFEGRWNIFDISENSLVGERDILFVRPNLTPDFFRFTDAVSAPIYTNILSNVIAIAGIENAVPMRVINGEYSIDGNPYTSEFRYANAGEFVRVRGRSSESNSSQTEVTLVVGGYRTTFSITTTGDATPNPFAFINRENAPLDTVMTSLPMVISGTVVPAPISISGGEYQIEEDGEFTSDPSTVSSGQNVTVRARSSATVSTDTVVELSISGVIGTFIITTESADVAPEGLRFNNLTGAGLNTVNTSSTVTVNSINVAAPVTIAGGEYSVNGGAFTAGQSTINPGDNITIRMTSPASYSSTATALLTIGVTNIPFSVTTLSFDQVPTFLLGQLYIFPYDPLDDQSILTLFSGSTMQFYMHNVRRGNSGSIINNAEVILEIHDDTNTLITGPIQLINTGSQGDYAVTLPHDAPLEPSQTYTVTVIANSSGSRGRWASNLRVVERPSVKSHRLVLTPQ